MQLHLSGEHVSIRPSVRERCEKELFALCERHAIECSDVVVKLFQHNSGASSHLESSIFFHDVQGFRAMLEAHLSDGHIFKTQGEGNHILACIDVVVAKLEDEIVKYRGSRLKFAGDLSALSAENREQLEVATKKILNELPLDFVCAMINVQNVAAHGSRAAVHDSYTATHGSHVAAHGSHATAHSSRAPKPGLHLQMALQLERDAILKAEASGDTLAVACASLAENMAKVVNKYINLPLHISSRHIDASKYLHVHCTEAMRAVAHRYVLEPIDIHVTFSKPLYSFQAAISFAMPKKVQIGSHGEGRTAYAAFDSALARLINNIKRYKAKLEHHRKSRDKDQDKDKDQNKDQNKDQDQDKNEYKDTLYSTESSIKLSKYVLSDEHVNSDDVPTIKVIQETSLDVDVMTVDDAVAMMNLSGVNTLIFKNLDKDKSVHVLYRRHDGNISLVDVESSRSS